MQTFTYESKSGGKPHTARVHPDGRIVCTCRGFSSPNKCWHVRDVAAKIGPQPVQTTIDLQDVDRNQPHWLSGETATQTITDDPMRVDPMLASALPEGKTIADYESDEYVLEEKIDGHRLIIQVSHVEQDRGAPYDGVRLDNGVVVNIVAWSRAGNVRSLPPHLIAALANLAAATYDSELYVPGGTSTDVTALDKEHLLCITIFDILRVGPHSVMDKTGAERRVILEYAATELESGPVKIIAQWPVSKATLDAIWNFGGEGAVIKLRSMKYFEGKRPSGWIKFKKPEALEVRITGFEKGKLGPHSVILGVDRKGIETRCKTLNDAWRAEFARNAEKYIGMTLVVSHFGLAASGKKYKSVMADHILGAKL